MFYTKRGNSDRATVIAGQDEILADALKPTYSTKEIKKMLFLAKIRGTDSELKCVNPFQITCGFLKPETDLELEETKKTINAEYEMPGQIPHTKPFKLQPWRQNTLFLISMTQRKGMERITKADRKNFRDRDMCVVAGPGQSFKDAILQDGRFVNVDRYVLTRRLEGACGPAIDIEAKPGELKGVLTFDVKVKKAVKSTRKVSHITTTSDDPTNESVSGVQRVEQSEQIAKTPWKKTFNILTEKMWKKNAIYVFSKNVDDLSSEQIALEMEECLKAVAWWTLVSPNDRKRVKCEKKLARVAKIQFANQNVMSRPVRFTRALNELYGSIGYLWCGHITASCFLINNEMVATNWHVVDAIQKSRRASLPYNFSEVYVHFDYEFEGSPPTESEHKLRPFLTEGNVMGQELDYAFLLLEEFIEGRKTLGELVRCNVPEQGKLCICGHPGGAEKADELCPIMPFYKDRRSPELERRLDEQQYLTEFSVFMCHENVRTLSGGPTNLTYDVGSMFQGSSGSPVFDMCLNIVALHTKGFSVEGANIVEAGITFNGIIKDLEARGMSEFVRECFPYCWDDDMTE